VDHGDARARALEALKTVSGRRVEDEAL